MSSHDPRRDRATRSCPGVVTRHPDGIVRRDPAQVSSHDTQAGSCELWSVPRVADTTRPGARGAAAAFPPPRPAPHANPSPPSQAGTADDVAVRTEARPTLDAR